MTTAVVLLAALTMFPGTMTECASPARTHTAIWQEPREGNGGHRLILRDHTGRSRELRRFDRWVKVLWSPDSRYLVVTDGIGSDVSETWLYDVVSGGDPVNIGARGVATLGHAVDGMHHLYVEVVRWRGAGRVVLRVHGHGDGRSIDRHVEVRVT
jgi:hypothetical protein